ncbi:MAG TPA: hypothetical protein VEB43_17275 [Anaeromyxobacter sp.]|nr:hypothetical protein [Anaeromyxobacter sp.]
MKNAPQRLSSPVLLGALAALADAPTVADAPPALLGSWLGRLGDAPLALDLGADGTYTLGAMAGRWSAADGELLLDGAPLRYRLDGGATLLLTDPTGHTVGWRRVVVADALP